MNAKKINKNQTIKNILDKCNSSIGWSINIDKFNKESKSDKFLIGAAKFCGVPVVYV